MYAVTAEDVIQLIDNGILAPLSADKRRDLVRLGPDIDELTLDLWLLIHPDLRGVRGVV